MNQDNQLLPMLAVSAVVLNAEGKILLIRRRKEPDQDAWQLIAGGVNGGERLVEAVKRYLREKVGITETQSIEFTGKYYDDPKRNPGNFCIPFVFKVQVANDVVVSTDREYRWFIKEEIKDLPMALDNKQTLIDLALC
mgnify:CR=1 FL=1